MIDLHNHFLPGVDDGPETMEEALELARIAVADGIRHSVLTSHVHPERYPNTRRSLEPGYREFAARLVSENIPLNVSLSGEARLGPDLIDLVLEDNFPFLGEVGGFRVMLIEFPHAVIPPGSDRLITTLLRMNVRPLIAHPERNKAVMSEPGKLKPFIDLGCWIQFTAGSLAGRFGERCQQVAFELLAGEPWAVMASDAHNKDHRPPVLSEGHAAVAARFGHELADAMVNQRPARILGQELTVSTASGTLP